MACVSEPAPAVTADDGSSISAGVFRSSRPERGRVLRAACAVVALALSTLAVAQSPRSRPVPSIDAPEPARPRVSVPYDGAIAAYRAGRIEESLELTEDALKADARNPQLRFLRGVILTGTGRRTEALEVFRDMVRDFPELPEPYNNIAVIHADQGQWGLAREVLEQSVNAVPSYALAHENLGDVHLQLAAQAYAQAGKLDARNDSARGKLQLVRDLLTRTQALPAGGSTPRPGAPTQVTPQ